MLHASRLHESHKELHCCGTDAAAAAAAAVQDAEAAADAEANEEVENLLESYFVQIDRTYNRLKTLQEFMACAPRGRPNLWLGLPSLDRSCGVPLLCGLQWVKAVHKKVGVVTTQINALRCRPISRCQLLAGHPPHACERGCPSYRQGHGGLHQHRP